MSTSSWDYGNQEDWEEWAEELDEYYTDKRIQQLTQANTTWLRAGSRDARMLGSVLAFGRKLRRILGLR